MPGTREPPARASPAAPPRASGGPRSIAPDQRVIKVHRQVGRLAAALALDVGSLALDVAGITGAHFQFQTQLRRDAIIQLRLFEAADELLEVRVGDFRPAQQFEGGLFSRQRSAQHGARPFRGHLCRPQQQRPQSAPPPSRWPRSCRRRSAQRSSSTRPKRAAAAVSGAHRHCPRAASGDIRRGW